MRYRTIIQICCSLTAVGALLAGCAGPEKNAMLEEAKAAYAAARSDPQVIDNAPLELNQAGESLQKAENLQQNDAEEAAVTQQAYLARQKTAIARQAAQLKMAQKVIADADAERAQVLLQVRSQEAEKARRQAETQQQALSAAQTQAEEAQQRASELKKELAGLQAQQTERGIVLTLKNVVFELNKANLKPGAERMVDQIAAFLNNHPERKIMVEGFTDATGSADYNMKLSQDRADAVKQALVARGVDPDRIQTRGYGEEYPVATNDTAAGRQLNRRAEIVISNSAENITKTR